MEAIQKTVKIRVGRKCATPQARWCDPVGWEPSNDIEGVDACEGRWRWDTCEELAGLVWFDSGREEEGAEIEVPLKDLRVASCGDCRVIDRVRLPELRGQALFELSPLRLVNRTNRETGEVEQLSLEEVFTRLHSAGWPEIGLSECFEIDGEFTTATDHYQLCGETPRD